MSTMLVASCGGHLKELVKLAPRLRGVDDEGQLWITFDTPQSRSLLAGRDVVFVRDTAPRDLMGVAVNGAAAPRLLRRHRVERVVTTGAGIALSFLPHARVRGADCHYIESAARCAGPSLTGRILQRMVPGVHLYSQYHCWGRGPWRHRGSVFDAYAAAERPRPADGPLRVVVSLGTIGYSFRRLLERLVRLLPQDANVLWQTGSTNPAGLGINARASLSAAELDVALRGADVAIMHSGVGSALAAFETGLKPILVPRRSAYREHVDDHQRQLARELSARGLALAREVEELTLEDVIAARAGAVAAVADPPRFELV